jgi:hypothetical protein
MASTLPVFTVKPPIFNRVIHGTQVGAGVCYGFLQNPQKGPKNKDRSMIREVENLIGIRKELGLSRARVGLLLSLPENSIFRWETGRTIPRGLYLSRLRQFLRAVEEVEDRDE